MNSDFQLAFTTVAFNNSYDDVYRFKSRAEQESFFEVARLFQNAPYVNILLSDFVNMTITYKLEGQTIFDLEKYNYCILRETVSENNYKYYYYFVNSMTYDSGSQFIIRLECDVMQTYYLGCTFAPCLINRAHLDRWKGKVNNTVTFNNAPNSAMLIPETVTPFAKYCAGRYRLGLARRSLSDPIIDWLNANVECWVYIFLQRTNVLSAQGNQIVVRKYTVGQYDNALPFSPIQIELPTIQYDDGRGVSRTEERYFTALCYPIYRKGVTKRLLIRGKYQNTTLPSVVIGSYAEQFFTSRNDDTSYYISKQISRIPPFTTFGTETTDYEIYDGNLIINSTISDPNDGLFSSNLGCNYVLNGVTYTDSTINQYHGLISPTTLWTQIGLEPNPSEFVGIQNTYNVTDIVGSNYSANFNPKIRGSQFLELTISNEAGTQFSYDPQKMDDTSSLKFIYSEYPTPTGASRGYLRLASAVTDYGVYTPPTQENLTGLVFSQDTNLNFANNQLASYLANNRNFQTQIAMKIGQNAINTVLGVSKNLVSTYTGGKARQSSNKAMRGAMAQEGTGAAFDVLSNIINTAFDMQNMYYSLDNMKGSPDMISTANGQVLFNSTYSEIGLYLEVYQCIPSEAFREAQRMNLYGFAYAMIDNLKNYDYIRKYFNYVSANIGSVTYYDGTQYVGLPTPILNIMKGVFSKGVRFWNVADTGVFLNYTKENYERNLE